MLSFHILNMPSASSFSLLSLLPWLKSLTVGEWWGYGSALVVVVGVIGESIADLTNWLEKRPDAKRKLEVVSALILILGLTGDIVSIHLTQVEMASITKEAGDAETSSTKAAQAASSAEDSARSATNEVGTAKIAAGQAVMLARGARQEADSFEKDIVSAKDQAADAESHLAEALRRAADASAELNRLKSPRLLVDTAGLAAALKPFSGTEFKFSSVFGDSESIELLEQLDAAVDQAGWRRIKQTVMNLGIPVIQLHGRKDDLINLGINTGVRVEVEVETPEAMQALPDERLPPHVKLAVFLNQTLQAHVSPPEPPSPDQLVNLVSGSSKVIRIKVGKKP